MCNLWVMNFLLRLSFFWVCVVNYCFIFGKQRVCPKIWKLLSYLLYVVIKSCVKVHEVWICSVWVINFWMKPSYFFMQIWMLYLIVVDNSLGEKYWEFYGMLTIIFDMLCQSSVNFECVYFELWNFKWTILFGIMLCFDYILLKWRNGTSLKDNIMIICHVWIY